MQRWAILFMAVALVAGTAFAPTETAASMALVGSASGAIEGKPVSASVVFTIVGDLEETEQGEGRLQILLMNTGTRNDYAEAHVLSDITFNMPDADFDLVVGDGSGSSVVVAPHSKLFWNKSGGVEPAGFDISSEWALARNTTLLPPDGFTGNLGPYDYSVTATSFGGGETKFASGQLDESETVNGPDFGVLNPQTDPTEPPIKNHEVVIRAVLITLAATRGLTDADLKFIQIPAFSYGSLHTGIRGLPDDFHTTPEPASLIVWLLMGSIWAACLYRFRRSRRSCRLAAQNLAV